MDEAAHAGQIIGCGTFVLAAMVAFAYLIQRHAAETRWWKLAPLALLGLVLCFEPIVFRTAKLSSSASYWAVYFGVSVLIVGGILAGRQRIAARLPAPALLDDLMYKAIAVGFACFPIATILGAFWAAEASGRLPELKPERDPGAGRAGGHHHRLPGPQHGPVGAAQRR